MKNSDPVYFWLSEEAGKDYDCCSLHAAKEESLPTGQKRKWHAYAEFDQLKTINVLPWGTVRLHRALGEH